MDYILGLVMGAIICLCFLPDKSDYRKRAVELDYAHYDAKTSKIVYDDERIKKLIEGEK